MIMVSVGTFSWNSIPNLRHHPWPSSVVMLTTVIVVVTTHDLSMGVMAGVLLSGIFFAGKVQRMFAVERSLSADGTTATYRVSGQIFFASVDRFVRAFHSEETAGGIPDRPDGRTLLGHFRCRCPGQDCGETSPGRTECGDDRLQSRQRRYRRQVCLARKDRLSNRCCSALIWSVGHRFGRAANGHRPATPQPFA